MRIRHTHHLRRGAAPQILPAVPSLSMPGSAPSARTRRRRTGRQLRRPRQVAPTPSHPCRRTLTQASTPVRRRHTRDTRDTRLSTRTAPRPRASRPDSRLRTIPTPRPRSRMPLRSLTPPRRHSLSAPVPPTRAPARPRPWSTRTPSREPTRVPDRAAGPRVLRSPLRRRSRRCRSCRTGCRSRGTRTRTRTTTCTNHTRTHLSRWARGPLPPRVARRPDRDLPLRGPSLFPACHTCCRLSRSQGRRVRIQRRPALPTRPTRRAGRVRRFRHRRSRALRHRRS